MLASPCPFAGAVAGQAARLVHVIVQNPEAVALARSITTSQQHEIDTMTQLLDQI